MESTSTSLFQINRIPLQKVFHFINTSQTYITLDQFASFCRDMKIFPEILSKLDLHKTIQVMQRYSETSLKNQGIDFRGFESALILIAKLGFSYKKDEDRIKALFLHLNPVVQQKYGVQLKYQSQQMQEKQLTLSPKTQKIKKEIKVIGLYNRNIYFSPKGICSNSNRANEAVIEKIQNENEKNSKISQKKSRQAILSGRIPLKEALENNFLRKQKSKRPHSSLDTKNISQKNLILDNGKQNKRSKRELDFRRNSSQNIQIEAQNKKKVWRPQIQACSYQGSPRNFNRMIDQTPPPGPAQFQFQQPKSKINIINNKGIKKQKTPPSRNSQSTRCSPSKNEAEFKLLLAQQIFQHFRNNQEKIQRKFNDPDVSKKSQQSQIKAVHFIQNENSLQNQNKKLIAQIQYLKNQRISNKALMKICFGGWKLYAHIK